MSRAYVDNAQNRSLGRVGMPVGSMVVSKSGNGGGSGYSNGGNSGYSGSSTRSYVDNSYNRSAGRVGMPVGSMVIPKGGGGGDGGYSRQSGGDYSGFSGSSARSYVDNSYNRSMGRVDMPFGSMPISKSGSGGERNGSTESSKTYVDNAYNRSAGRVGMAKGSMPIHRGESASGSQRSLKSSDSGFCSRSKTYVDNSYNRSAGRAGMPMGSMQIHRGDGSTESSKTYVDNSYNRSAGRVGMTKGSMPIHRGESASGSRRSVEISSPELGSRSKTYVDNAYNRSHDRVGMEHGTAVVRKTDRWSSEPVTYSRPTPTSPQSSYANNAQNRKLGRVGLDKGSAPVSRKDPGKTKVYMDNYMNRKLGRVGKIVGTAVYHKATGKVRKEFYINSPNNQKLDRVGKPRGCRPAAMKCGITKAIPKMLEKLQNGEELVDFGDYRGIDEDFYSGISEGGYRELFEQAMCRLNRQNEEMGWKTTHGSKPKTKTSLLTYFEESIPFSELNLSAEKKIGEGAFGEVFLTKWNGSAVAVKKLKLNKFSKRQEDAFKHEILTFSALDHPNIVKFLGACVERPNLCIVMEYMQMSLYDALHTEADITFSEKERLDIITDVCKGILYLHCEGIAHCDLKTLNVLVNYTEGKTCIAKITDFGLSLVKSSTQTGSTHGDESVCGIGTPRYSAPEVLRGEMLKAYDMMKADIWSLGLVIYETIYEEEPFCTLSYVQLKVQVGEKRLKPALYDDVIINPDIMAALLQTWRSVPRDRVSIDELTEVAESANYLFVE